MLVVGDLEAPNLDPDYIHCGVLIEPNTGQMYEFHDEPTWALETSIWAPRDEFPKFIEKSVTNLVGHNFRGYDIPVLKKIYGLDYKGVITDTVIWSRCLYPDRPRPEGYTGNKLHSLEAWGYRVDRGKPDYNEWEVFDEAMLHRCREDVEINLLVWKELLWEMFCRNTGEPFSTYWDYNPPAYPAWIRMEEQVASIIDQQERDGVFFDSPAALQLIEQLSVVIERAETTILPLLPQVEKVSLVEKTFPACWEEPFTKAGKWKSNVLKYYDEAIQHHEIDVDSPVGEAILLKWLGNNIKVPPTKKVTYRPMKIKSPQFKEWLMAECGWRPTEWNLKKVTKKEAEDPQSPYFKQQAGKFARDRRGKHVKASPKLTEDSYDSIQGGYGPTVKEYLVASHRASMVEGFLNNAREDGTIGAGADSCGAATTRMKHRTVVNVPRIGSPYGEECRALFRARPGRVFVGADAAALEARMEAHYTYKYDDGAYAKEVLEGDIHTKNALAFGLVTPELVAAYRAIPDHDKPSDDTERDIVFNFSCGRNGGGDCGGGAKGAKYCLTYGGQAPKLAETLNKPKHEGEMHFEAFWETNISLRMFRDDVEKEWKANEGWIQAIDGRWLKARSPHSLVNLKFQSSGSIVCKTATAFLAAWIKKEKIDALLVINMHDEVQADCHPDSVERLKELMCRAFVKAGEYWGLAVPTPGEAKSGDNWARTH
jgi:hypothetical protein